MVSKRKISLEGSIDLTAAYDTVRFRILLDKIYNLTNDKGFTRIIKKLLQHRRFYVTLVCMKIEKRNKKK